MIDAIAGFLHRNLIVGLAVVVIPLKWFVVRVCYDKEGEAVALLSVPEDLCYVVLGLVLGDVINNTGAFHKHFAKSPYISMDIGITVAIGVIVALAIHVFAQRAEKHYKGWRAASKTRKADIEDPKEGPQSLENAEENLQTLRLRHLFLFLMAYAAQLGLILPWLHWIAKVIGEA